MGSEAMEGLSTKLADVEALAPESEGSDPEKGDAEQEEDEDAEPKSKSKTTKCWDRDRHVNKAHKTIDDRLREVVRVGKLPACQMQGDLKPLNP